MGESPHLHFLANNLSIGPLEQSILQSQKRGANIRWWLSQNDCPEVIRQFKIVFDKAFSPWLPRDSRDSSGEVAHIVFDGVRYSRAATHLGNSLISYYPSKSSTVPVVGSIQKITTNNRNVCLTVKRQAPLPTGTYDPFLRYPAFPARLYSSGMINDHDDHIPITSVVSHVARFMVEDPRVTVFLSLSQVGLSIC